MIGLRSCFDGAAPDGWARGEIGGLYLVLTCGDPMTGRAEFPVSAAGYVFLALQRIKYRHLIIAPEAVELARDWLKEVGG